MPRYPVDQRIVIPGHIPFGQPDPNAKHGFHAGDDSANAEGTPVYAWADGVVTPAVGALTSPQGLVVEIFDGTFYPHTFHLEQVLVSPGQRVKEGQLVAYSGRTGTSSTGPHTHNGVGKVSWPKSKSINDYIDPMEYTKGAQDMPRVPIPPEVVAQHYANFTTNLVKVTANDPAAQNRFEDTVDDEFWYGLCFQLKDLLRDKIAEVDKLKKQLADSQGEFIETKVYIKKG